MKLTTQILLCGLYTLIALTSSTSASPFPVIHCPFSATTNNSNNVEKVNGDTIIVVVQGEGNNVTVVNSSKDRTITRRSIGGLQNIQTQDIPENCRDVFCNNFPQTNACKSSVMANSGSASTPPAQYNNQIQKRIVASNIGSSSSNNNSQKLYLRKSQLLENGGLVGGLLGSNDGVVCSILSALGLCKTRAQENKDLFGNKIHVNIKHDGSSNGNGNHNNNNNQN